MRRLIWCASTPIIVGLIVATMMMSPMVSATTATLGDMAVKVATLEERVKHIEEQVVDFRAEFRGEFASLRNALVGGMLSAILTLGGLLWQTRKR